MARVESGEATMSALMCGGLGLGLFVGVCSWGWARGWGEGVEEADKISALKENIEDVKQVGVFGV